MEFSKDLKVLMVDDMATIRMFFKKAMENIGMKNVVEAEDGDKAWEALEKNHADGSPIQIVMSDLNMPGLNGIQLLTKIRGDNRFKDLPFIVVTGEEDSEHTEAAKQAGATDFISKTFSLDSLKDTLTEILNKI